MVLRDQLVCSDFFLIFYHFFVLKRRRKKFFPQYTNHVTLVFTRDIIEATPRHLRCLSVSRLPLIDYGSNTWGSTSKLNIERLSKLQKRAARIILKADFDTPSSEMFNELGWSTIANRHNYNKAVLTFKALNDHTPEYISNLLKPTFETHNSNLRSATNGSLSVPRSRTYLFDRSCSATAPKVGNSPNHLGHVSWCRFSARWELVLHLLLS